MSTLLTKPDFKDWYSPMLVKELRQGLRSRIFMSAFFLTQVLMILSTIFNLTASNENGYRDTTDMLSGLFWFMIAVPVVLLTPIRGFGTLHGEMKEHTLELVFLTRLSAWRITAGKWTALMVQTLLLVCGILPYVLLRYFLGGINIIGDLHGLAILLITSGVLTALTVALSPYESKLLRGLLIAGLFIGFFIFLNVFFQFFIAELLSSIGSFSILYLYGGLALFVPAVIVLALEVGATRIAPPAENHSIRKRLIGLYFLAAGTALTLTGLEAGVLLNFVLAILTIVVIDALGESQQMMRVIYQPFYRRGAIGRFLGLFLTPGWVSASWYVLLLSVLVGAVMLFTGEFADENVVLARLAFLGALLFPAALIRLFAPNTPHFLGFYIALQFFFTAVSVLSLLLTSFSGQSAPAWLAPLPGCVFFMRIGSHIRPEQMSLFLNTTGLVTMGALFILLARSFAPLRDIRNLFRQSEGSDA